MYKYIAILLLSYNLNAGFLDFFTLRIAEENYKNKKYKDSIKIYENMDLSKDEIAYNLANNLYKEKEYKKSLILYKKIKKEKLLFKTNHNIGNSYAMLKQYKEAISYYEIALQIKKDKDTLFNLNLMKKKLEEEKNKKDKENNSDKNNINKNEEISELEIKKYTKILNKKHTRTLLIPIENKIKDKNENNSW